MENNAHGRYTVIIFTENKTGLLQQFTNIFTRQNLDIWSLFASPAVVDGFHKLTIETSGTEAKIALAVKQIEKKVEVIKAIYYSEDEMVSGKFSGIKLEIK